MNPDKNEIRERQEARIKIWTCPQCSEVNESGLRFCKKCGLEKEKRLRLRGHPCWCCVFLDEKSVTKAGITTLVPICTCEKKNVYGLDFLIPVSRCCYYKDAETPDKTDKERCLRCGRMAWEDLIFTISVTAPTGKTVMSIKACLLCVERVPGWEHVKWPPEEG